MHFRQSLHRDRRPRQISAHPLDSLAISTVEAVTCIHIESVDNDGTFSFAQARIILDSLLRRFARNVVTCQKRWLDFRLVVDGRPFFLSLFLYYANHFLRRPKCHIVRVFCVTGGLEHPRELCARHAKRFPRQFLGDFTALHLAVAMAEGGGRQATTRTRERCRCVKCEILPLFALGAKHEFGLSSVEDTFTGMVSASTRSGAPCADGAMRHTCVKRELAGKLFCSLDAVSCRRWCLTSP
jgi:hypothetical protein